MKKMNDCHCREYKILEAQWRLFHKDSADLEAGRSDYLRGVNEYMTQQNALDLIANYPVFYAALRYLQKRGSSVCFGKHGCCIWQEGTFS